MGSKSHAELLLPFACICCWFLYFILIFNYFIFYFNLFITFCTPNIFAPEAMTLLAPACDASFCRTYMAQEEQIQVWNLKSAYLGCLHGALQYQQYLMCHPLSSYSTDAHPMLPLDMCAHLSHGWFLVLIWAVTVYLICLCRDWQSFSGIWVVAELCCHGIFCGAALSSMVHQAGFYTGSAVEKVHIEIHWCILRKGLGLNNGKPEGSKGYKWPGCWPGRGSFLGRPQHG